MSKGSRRKRVSFSFDGPSEEKRVGFLFEAGADGATAAPPEGEGSQRRGTPHPHKKSKQVDDVSEDEDELCTIPGMKGVVDANRCESPYDPSFLAASNDTGGDDEAMEEEQGTDETDKAHDSSEEAVEEDEEESEDEQKWAEFLEDKKAKGEVKSCEGLDIFLKGNTRWENSNEKLGSALVKFDEQMHNKADRVCQHIVASIHSTRQCELNELSASCKTLLVQNYHRRNKLLKTLQKADKAWTATKKALVSQTLDDAPNSSGEESTMDAEEARDGVDADGGEDDEEVWNGILGDCKHERAEIAQVYLAAQDRLEAAEARFQQALSRTDEEWKGKVQSIIEMIVAIHGDQSSEINGLSGYIKGSMVANHDRGEDYTRKLNEANESRQAFFQNLLQKVATKGAKGKPGRN